MNRYFYRIIVLSFLVLPLQAGQIMSGIIEEPQSSFDGSDDTKQAEPIMREVSAEFNLNGLIAPLYFTSVGKDEKGLIEFNFSFPGTDTQLLKISTDKDLNLLMPVLYNKSGGVRCPLNRLVGIAAAVQNNTTELRELLESNKRCKKTPKALKGFIEYCESYGYGKTDGIALGLKSALDHHALYSPMSEMYKVIKSDFLQAEKERTHCPAFPFESIPKNIKSSQLEWYRLNLFAKTITGLCEDFFMKIVDADGQFYTFPQERLCLKLTQEQLIEAAKKRLSKKEERKRQKAICAYFKSLEAV